MAKIFRLLILLCAFFVTTFARADGTFGVFAGPSFVNQNFGTRFVFGAQGTVKVIPTIGVGMYASYESLSSSTSGSSAFPQSTSVGQALIAATLYYYPLANDSLYLGGKLGIGLTNLSVTIAGTTTASNSYTNLAFGPTVGYNFMFYPGWSFDVEFNGLWVTTGGSLGSTLNAFNILGGINYWFQ